MPKITIDLDETVLTQLDAICEKSGYTRSEQIEGMVAAEVADASGNHECPVCHRTTDDVTDECWDCMEKTGRI